MRQRGRRTPEGQRPERSEEVPKAFVSDDARNLEVLQQFLVRFIPTGAGGAPAS
jgi:hypothetical protein